MGPQYRQTARSSSFKLSYCLKVKGPVTQTGPFSSRKIVRTYQREIFAPKSQVHVSRRVSPRSAWARRMAARTLGSEDIVIMVASWASVVELTSTCTFHFNTTNETFHPFS